MSHFSKGNTTILITTALICGFMLPCSAESLFRAGVSHTVAPLNPKSLFASIRATNVGDLITIVVNETTSIENTVAYDSNAKSDTSSPWTDLLSRAIPQISTWGGESKINKSASTKTTNGITHNITAQVVQVLPNGNLVIQGRKEVVNAGERQNFVLSGVVNPRLVDGNGRIKSEYVSNLQVAIVGKGTVSRADTDGIMNKLLYLFF